MKCERVNPCSEKPQSETCLSTFHWPSSSDVAAATTAATSGVDRLTRMRLLLLTVVLYASLAKVECLELLRLEVPSIVDPRSDKVALRCEYDLGDEDLYSVKWYKDGDEFFTYMPSIRPPGREYDVEGVKVDVGRSDSKQVILLGQAHSPDEIINLAGSYGCEVSVEAPSFLTAFGAANMSVAVLPQRDPALEGLRPHYDVGDILEAECTSAPSYPPAVLTFLLNHMEVSKALTRPLPDEGHVEGNVVSTTRLGLSLRLQRHHFPGGSLSLICRSALPGIPGARIRKSESIVALAASNQRLAQEPPKAAASGILNTTLIRNLNVAITLLHLIFPFTL